MKSFIVILIALFSSHSLAVVLSEGEVQKIQEQVQKQNRQLEVQLKSIEYRAVFEDGDFQYFEVATETHVEVSENSNRSILFPKISAKSTNEKVLNSVCQILGGQRTSDFQHEIKDEKISDRSDFGLSFMRQVQLVKYRSWHFNIESEFRCYDKSQ